MHFVEIVGAPTKTKFSDDSDICGRKEANSQLIGAAQIVSKQILVGAPTKSLHHDPNKHRHSERSPRSEESLFDHCVFATITIAAKGFSLGSAQLIWSARRPTLFLPIKETNCHSERSLRSEESSSIVASRQ
jgi:hypothetical protein